MIKTPANSIVAFMAKANKIQPIENIEIDNFSEDIRPILSIKYPASKLPIGFGNMHKLAVIVSGECD